MWALLNGHVGSVKLIIFQHKFHVKFAFFADSLSFHLFSALSFSFRDKLIQSSSIAALQQVPVVTLFPRCLQIYCIAAN